MGKTAVLVVAAGRGRRFGGDLPKQYHDLAGRMVLRHTLAAFATNPQVDLVRAVIHPDDRQFYDMAAAGLAILDPVPGGASRQDSVRLGLESLDGLGVGKVLIHDGARPFIDSGIIGRVVAGLDTHGAVLPAVPVADTLKRGGGGVVAGTVDRDGLFRAQTPQGFRYAGILAAHKAVIGEELTDDAAVAERAGTPVALVAGSEDNVKITTAHDLERARRLFDGPGETRAATGFDVHAFEDGGGCWLCGVLVPHDRRLKGHSDADVGLHALTDAVLGAICAGDIGHHFPPGDMRWKGVESWKFLAHAASLVAARGGRIVNVDVTLICERPKVGPHRPAMVAKVAEILGISQDRVSVKATTTEELGFTGRREGIAAQAMASVWLPR